MQGCIYDTCLSTAMHALGSLSVQVWKPYCHCDSDDSAELLPLCRSPTAIQDCDNYTSHTSSILACAFYYNLCNDDKTMYAYNILSNIAIGMVLVGLA